MIGSIGQAILRILLASLGVVTVVFVALRIAGDPVTIALPPGTPLDVREIYRKAWGLDGTLVEQYGHFLARLGQGDLGRSLAFDRPATTIIRASLPFYAVLLMCVLIITYWPQLSLALAR